MIPERVRLNTATDLNLYLGDGDTATDADGDVDVVVKDANGDTMTSGTATNQAVGHYTFTLAAQSQVKELTVLWSGEISSDAFEEQTFAQVIGGHYISLRDLRDVQGADDQTAFPDTELIAARTVAEQLVDDFTEKAWSKRYAREVHDGNDHTYLFVDRTPARELIAVTIGGTAATLTDWTIQDTGLIRTDGDVFTTEPIAGQNVVVEYVYGEDRPPADLARAVLRLARHILLSTDTSIPDRARLMTTEFAQFHLVMANRDYPTGLPEVDAVLNRYRRELPAFA